MSAAKGYLALVGIALAGGLLWAVGSSGKGDSTTPKKRGVSHYDIVGVANYRGPDTLDKIKNATEFEGVTAKATDNGLGVQVTANLYSMDELNAGDTFTANGVPIRLMKVERHELT